ncbi:hypothetical protein QAD02_016995 [Eretmocerus hayati]|uniref:Uncharacterized protein n=1 Tax=Eretmocerus hayati TaxID=131215 RepID=A0ACC2PDP6_9HYME|nr:hypothetical protein QAD02_016995 [Eretmocerus hayati]
MMINAKYCCAPIPQRWVFALMGFLALVMAYGMRVSLSIAITEMARPVKTPESRDDTCTRGPSMNNTVSRDDLYDWSEPVQGMILSSFYWGYVITQVPGALIAERFGGKHTLGLGMLITAILTMAIPFAVEWGDYPALIVLRILMGLGEGVTLPALNVMLSQWTPPDERSKTGSFVYVGAPLGTVFANSLSGLILQHSKWQMVFYFFGLMGALWYAIWLLTCYSTPREHPFISDKEAAYLEQQLKIHVHEDPPPVPWRRMLTSMPMFALIAVQVGHDWGFYTVANDLPKYMAHVLHYPVDQNGYLSSIPYVGMWLCCLVTSCLADWLISSGLLSITSVRKLGTTLASIGPGLFLLAASYAECDRTLVVAMFILGVTMLGCGIPSLKVNSLDLSPNYAGSVQAISNGAAACTGIITPMIVGFLTEGGQTIGQWRTVFWIIFAILITTNIFYLIFGSGEVQEWNDVNSLDRTRTMSKEENGKTFSWISNQNRYHLLISDKCIPQRWIVASMAFFAFFNAYTLRMCLSIAITKMTVPINVTQHSIDETCPNFEEPTQTNRTLCSSDGGTFHWDEYTQGIILSSFYWGYVLTHIPGGLLAEKFGAKHVIGLGVLFTAILTLLTPAATHLGDAEALILIRFLMGLGEGVIQPGISYLLAQWIPAHERSLTASIVHTGVRSGALLSTVIPGLILSRSSSDWPQIFYLFGWIGVAWFVFSLFLCYSSPSDHPFITEKEKTYLEKHIGTHVRNDVPSFPWKHALTSKPFLALVIMQAGQDYSNYTIMSDLPKYMNSVLKLPVALNGYASSMHQISSVVFCMIMSALSDWLIANEYMSRTNVRKMNATIASIGPGVMLIMAMYAGCDVVWAVTLITVGLTLTGSSTPGTKVNCIDISPNYSGTLMGISNGVAAVMGIFAPYVVGILAPNQTLSEWRLIFWIAGIVYLVADLNFLIFASGDIQMWNDPAFLSREQNRISNVEEDLKLLNLKKNPE